MKRKGCPLLIQQDTNPSLTVSGQSWTRSYMLECIGEQCAAYNRKKFFCERFQCCVIAPQPKEADHEVGIPAGT